MKKRLLLFTIFVVILAAALAACGAGDERVQLTEEMIRSDGLNGTYVYTGQPITFFDFKVYTDGNFLDLDLFEVTFSDNVNVGTASVTITAKEGNTAVKGSVTMHFSIVADNGKHCEAKDDLALLLANPGYSAVEVWCAYAVKEGETITVPQGKTLYLRHGYQFENNGTIVNEGNILLEGAHLSTGGRSNTVLINRGAIENHGVMEIKDSVRFLNYGTFESDNEIKNRGEVYLLEEDKSFLSNEERGARFVRHQIASSDVSVVECAFVQGVAEYQPQVTLLLSRNAFDLTYSDNTRAGTAQATVKVGAYDEHYYGEITVPFEIKKGKATASSFEELKALIASCNFDAYTIPSLTVPEEESLTLPAGEALTVGDRLCVLGRFTANGEVNCKRFCADVGCDYTSNALLKVSGSELAVRGRFVNGEKGDWEYDYRIQSLSLGNSVTVYSGGNFINNGTVTDKGFFLYGTLKNEGTIALTLTGSGAFVNSGSATLTSNNGSASFLNERGGTLVISGANVFEKSFRNDGVVVNKGFVSFAENCEYSCAGSFDNKGGEVWVFRPLAGIGDRVHLRHKLESAEAVFAPEYLETPYNEQNQQPLFTVNGEAISASDYTIKYRYVGENKDASQCVKIGEIKVSVSIQNAFSIFAGEAEFIYQITPATVHVTRRNFESASGNKNYGRLVLDEDLTVTYYGSVLAGCTLDLNGHKLIIEDLGTFRLYGTLVGAAPVDPLHFVPSEEEASVIVSYGRFENYGRIENQGFLYEKRNPAGEGSGVFSGNARDASTGQTGVIVNNGVIYCSYDLQVESESSGRVVRRYDVADLWKYIALPEVFYDEEAHTPVPELTYQTLPVDIGRFRLTYYSNVKVGWATVRLDVADLFDEEFFGTTFAYFEIKRGTAEVGDAASFQKAAADRDYQTIILTNSFALTSGVTLSADQTIDLGDYDITSSSPVTFGEGCRLILSANNEDRFLKYVYGADEITLTADIGKAGSLTTIDFKNSDLSEYEGENLLSVVVHMNGHSFLGGLSIVNAKIENFSFTFENSSVAASAIGSAVGGYAFVYGVCTEETYVTLRNLTIYGVEHKGGDGTAQVADLSAENCVFLASHEDEDDYAFYLWTRMTASGTFTDCTFEGANGFYVNRGYHFKDGKTLPAYLFYRCVFRAYGPYIDQYRQHYGNALTLDRNDSNLYVSLNECELSSENGNCIRIVTATGVYCDVDQLTTFSHPEGKADIL